MVTKYNSFIAWPISSGIKLSIILKHTLTASSADIEINLW